MSWKLHIGCHRGTMMSRDSQMVKHKYHSNGTEPLESLQDCIDTARDWEKNYNSFGCFLWFANATAPDGTQHPNIIPGTSYR